MTLAQLLHNPILRREVDHRMRDNRTYFIPMVYIFVLGIVSLGAYLAMTELGKSAYAPVEGWVIGKVIFHLVAFTQMTLILLIVPSVSAGAITSERDHGTLSMLLVTPMPRSRITVGKLVAPILYVLLLVSTSIPFAALSFGFGGTDMGLLLATYACLACTTLFIAALGLCVSTVMQRTVPAVLLAYGLVAAIFAGSLVGELALHVFIPDLAQIFFAYLNPYAPLYFTMIPVMDPEPVLRVHWWITPVLELALSALLVLVSALRIRTMR